MESSLELQRVTGGIIQSSRFPYSVLEEGQNESKKTKPDFQPTANAIPILNDDNASRRYGNQPNYSLTVRSLSYKVRCKPFRLENGTFQTEKSLLTKVNADAKAGEIMAVVGPSGAGKSTILDAIAGRVSPDSLEGSILVNGAPVTRSFRRVCSYAFQDDFLFPMLTVRETLMFSARLRLPSNMPPPEKAKRVTDLLNLLGLSQCANTRIGDEKIRGVSGGEKRRCSIGVDLIHNPLVMFLDEPTSGLDSSSAINVMEILHKLARNRMRTIVLTIHQPSFRILDLIDSLLLLANGCSVFHGPPSELPPYLTSLGRNVPEHVNVLEYAMDVVEEYQNLPSGIYWLVTAQRNRDSEQGRTCSPESLPAGSIGLPLEVPTYASDWLSELWTLCDRETRNVFRSHTLTVSRITVMVVIGLTVGTLFFQCPISPSGASDRNSLLAFSVALLCYNSMDALPVFLQQRSVFVRESSQGAYRASTFVLSNFIVPLPIFLGLAILFASCAYWLAGLVASVPTFSFFLLTCFATLVSSNAWVVMWSAIAPNYYAANGVAAASFSYFFLFSGFFLTRNELPPYWLWLHYFNLFKYPLENFLWNEYTPLRTECFSEIGGQCVETGEQVLQSLDIGSVNPWQNFGVMAAFTLAFRVFFTLR